MTASAHRTERTDPAAPGLPGEHRTGDHHSLKPLMGTGSRCPGLIHDAPSSASPSGSPAPLYCTTFACEERSETKRRSRRERREGRGQKPVFLKKGGASLRQRSGIVRKPLGRVIPCLRLAIGGGKERCSFCASAGEPHSHCLRREGLAQERAGPLPMIDARELERRPPPAFQHLIPAFHTVQP
ncbi:hypothetical protein AOLI_G00210610 [Acnodon oligacanthus]